MGGSNRRRTHNDNIFPSDEHSGNPYTITFTLDDAESISHTVTFKVVNGSWDDGTTADKTVTLSGYEYDTLKLAAGDIPTVGTKPNDTYKAGNWDVTPSADTEITAATTYTYTYVAKEASVVTKAPEAKTLTYNGQAQELVTTGTATGGEMQYALGNATEATQPYTTFIPTGTEAGTYYVWYKVEGDDNHTDTEAVPVTVTIANKASYTVTFDSKGGSNVASATVTSGEKVSKPTNPTKSGYTFAGWYKDAAYTIAYDFDAVTSSFTLYAKWTSNAPYVPYVPSNSSTPTTPASEPAPTAETYTIPISNENTNVSITQKVSPIITSEFPLIFRRLSYQRLFSSAWNE